MNILFVSHCNFFGNSAMHVFSIANTLAGLGVSCAVCVPDHPETVKAHGEPQFQVLDYDQARKLEIRFSDGGPPDIIHAWTPRELVRRLTEDLLVTYDCPYVVHLEDNEEVILEKELTGDYAQISSLPQDLLDRLVSEIRSHPIRYRQFLTKSAGVTCLMDRLTEFVPPAVPHLTFFPGWDEEFAAIVPNGCFRKAHNIGPEEKVIAYTGNIHASNVGEIRSLVAAVGLLRRRGWPVKLFKTGLTYSAELFNGGIVDTAEWFVDLKFLPRRQLPDLLAAADILVQPGTRGPFNDYRFPAKLPEFLVSGKPVVLPHTNIGRFLQDGINCLLLEEGHSLEIVAKVERLLFDPELSARIGRAGRQFALDNLTWAKNVPTIAKFYGDLLTKQSEVRTNSRKSVDGRQSQHAPVPLKAVAFYLPQFHPIPENDEWWGKGFTEWTNVSRAKPSFSGHYQPRLPADMGFYDLRLHGVMEQQADLARRYGIYGFCFYYYWFNGRRLLELPLNQWLSSKKPDFPFCICWANENWTRRWDGSEAEVLMQQDYSEEGNERFIRDVIPILKDPRYIRVGDAPILLVYRVDKLSDPRRTVSIWRRIWHAESGLDLHLVAVQSFGIGDPRPFGFDASVEFPPHTKHVPMDACNLPDLVSDFSGFLEDYVGVMRSQIHKPLTDYVRYRGVMPDWDNTPRWGKRAHILVGASPELYESWLKFVARHALRLSSIQEPLVFINAWNEWAEGAYLEPDQKNGHSYLEATQRALSSALVEEYGSERTPRGERPFVPLSQLLPIGAVRAQSNPGEVSQSVSAMLAPSGVVALQQVYDHHSGRVRVRPLSYGTVRDYCDSYDRLQQLATANGDLKDVQRPWVFKALLSMVTQGARILEIGAGEPLVAHLLSQLGYEVWVVDPYDGSGNGPRDYERYMREYPHLRFVRSIFGDDLADLDGHEFDCIYSISVLEHVSEVELARVFRGMKKFLRQNGIAIHAIDHVHKGNDALDHLTKLRLMVKYFGFSASDLERMLVELEKDTDTYYLSAESHNRWRGALPYDEFPMRVCVSIQIAVPALMLIAPEN